LPRARNIKPGFFKNEDLVSLSPLTRILFIGLWTLADRDGRLEDRPVRIKIEILPCDNCDVDAMLNELSSVGFISRYVVGGVRCIQVVNFLKHQNPHQKEPSLGLPPPPGAPGASPVQAQGAPGVSPVPARLNPSSLNPSSLNPSTQGVPPPETPVASAKPPPEGKRSETTPTPPDNRPSETARTPSDTSQDATKARPRDELFDAVAEVTASDPKASGSHIGRVCKLLRGADPPYTADDVRRWATIITQQWSFNGPPTLGMLEKYIGRVRAPQTLPPSKGATNGRPKPSLRCPAIPQLGG
jgi:hypothetical protein